MDDGKGNFILVEDLKSLRDNKLQDQPEKTFHEGELLMVKSSLFEITSITHKRIVLKLLPKTNFKLPVLSIEEQNKKLREAVEFYRAKDIAALKELPEGLRPALTDFSVAHACIQEVDCEEHETLARS